MLTPEQMHEVLEAQSAWIDPNRVGRLSIDHASDARDRALINLCEVLLEQLHPKCHCPDCDITAYQVWDAMTQAGWVRNG